MFTEESIRNFFRLRFNFSIIRTIFVFLLFSKNARGQNFIVQEHPVQNANECHWIAEQMEIQETWKILEQNGKHRPGQGITIAQLDTGIIPIPSLLVTAKQSSGSSGLQLPSPKQTTHPFNLVQNILQPWDNDLHALNFGHGTTTASLLIGSMSNTGVSNFSFQGFAPWVRLIPIKVTDSVVLVGNMPTGGTADVRNLAQGINIATELHVDIISISLGAVFDEEGLIEPAIRRALENGIIVIAAAGQGMSANIAPLPARLPGVITVSASTFDKQPWSESFYGKHVDWSAPGVDVCILKAQQTKHPVSNSALDASIAHINGRNGDSLFFQDALVSTSGTSFSTVYTAAAAALWLQYHSPEALKNRYGQNNISKLLTHVAKHFAMETPNHWKTEKYGQGILNIRKLIEAPLPCQQNETPSLCKAINE